jgi:hypothetical protein
MGFRSLFTLCSLYLLYVSSVASAQGTQNPLLNEETPLLNEETDAFIDQVLRDFNSPGGAAVAVVRRDDQGTWFVETKGYGIATANGSRVTENTLFAIGSNSKVRCLSSLHGFESRLTRSSVRIALRRLRHGVVDPQRHTFSSVVLDVETCDYHTWLGSEGPNRS